MEDIVRTRGYLTLGSRFRRIGERLQADVQVMAERHGLDMPAGLFPTLGAINAKGTITVGELAQALGISQPGATRNVNQLRRLGLVTIKPSGEDGRVRHISLTKKCKAEVDRALRELWPQVERAVAEICEPLKGNLLEILDALEDALAAKPLPQRATTEKSK